MKLRMLKEGFVDWIKPFGSPAQHALSAVLQQEAQGKLLAAQLAEQRPALFGAAQTAQEIALPAINIPVHLERNK